MDSDYTLLLQLYLLEPNVHTSRCKFIQTHSLEPLHIFDFLNLAMLTILRTKGMNRVSRSTVTDYDVNVMTWLGNILKIWILIHTGKFIYCWPECSFKNTLCSLNSQKKTSKRQNNERHLRTIDVIATCNCMGSYSFFLV